MTEGFSNVIVETTVHLLPSRCNNSEQVEEGVRNLLNGMLMRYVDGAFGYHGDNSTRQARHIPRELDIISNVVSLVLLPQI